MMRLIAARNPVERAALQLIARRGFTGLTHRVDTTKVSRNFSTGKKTIPFILADIGEGIAEVELMQWFVAEGDTLNQFENVCEVQSDKATVEITSRFDGIVKKIHHKVGEMVQVGAALIDIEVAAEEGENETAPSLDTESTKPIIMDEPSGEVAASKKEILTTPAVRKLAKENGVDLSLVFATGPRGRILKSDILTFIGSSVAPLESPAADENVVATPSPSSVKPSSGSEGAPPNLALRKVVPERSPGSEPTVVPIAGIQRIMVKNMKESLKIPHFTFTEEVTMDALADLRGPLNDLGAAYGVKMSYLPLLLKALSLTLEDFPILNSSVSQDEAALTYHHDHNIGVAMDTPRGLLVPCIRKVQHKSVFEIAAELAELQVLGAEGKLGEPHLTGGTITVSNMGSIGGTVLSPVIMAPQTAIVALGRIQTLPRFKAYKCGPESAEQVVAPTKVMNMSWSGDHRVIDGATMAKFVNAWKKYLETPSLMVAQLR